MTNQILSFSKKMGASKVNKMVLCLDSPSWRKDYYINNRPNCPVYENQTYKGNREKDNELPWDVISEITEAIANLFKQHSDFYVMKVDGAEADDIIAVLANKFKESETIFVGSPDKDFIQLQDTNVHIYDPLKNAFKPEQDVARFKLIHSIIGDASDNIFAIKGQQKSMKETVALKMIKDIDDLLATNPLMREKFNFNEKLIDLSKIPEYIESSILAEFENQAHTFNSMGIMKVCMKYGMSKITEDVNSFKLSDKEVLTPTNQHFLIKKKNDDIARDNLFDFLNS